MVDELELPLVHVGFAWASAAVGASPWTFEHSLRSLGWPMRFAAQPPYVAAAAGGHVIVVAYEAEDLHFLSCEGPQLRNPPY